MQIVKNTTILFEPVHVSQCGWNEKKGNSNIEFPFLVSWVAGGTRTHDIQNHNLTL